MSLLLSSHVVDGDGGGRLRHEPAADGVLPPAQTPRVQLQRRRVDADTEMSAGARDADAEPCAVARAGNESGRAGECECSGNEHSDTGGIGEEG